MQQGKNTVNLKYGTGYTSPPEKYSVHSGCYVTVADRCQAVCNPFHTPALDQMEMEGGRWDDGGIDDLAARLAYAAGVCIDTSNLQQKVNSPELEQEKSKQGGVVEGGGKRSKRGMTTHSLLTWSRPPPVMPRHLTVTLYCLTVQSQRSGKVLRTTMNWRFMTDHCLLGVYISREISS